MTEKRLITTIIFIWSIMPLLDFLKLFLFSGIFGLICLAVSESFYVLFFIPLRIFLFTTVTVSNVIVITVLMFPSFPVSRFWSLLACFQYPINNLLNWKEYTLSLPIINTIFIPCWNPVLLYTFWSVLKLLLACPL